MHKRFLLLSSLLLLILAAGCGAETAPPAEPDSDTAIQTSEAKPQLIEFYADW